MLKMNCLAGFVSPSPVISDHFAPYFRIIHVQFSLSFLGNAGKSIFEYGPSHNMYLVLKIVFLLIRKMLFFARAIINILLLQCND